MDTAAYHYERPRSPLHITGVIIVAWPNGVHSGWVKDAFPENMPRRINWKGFIWRSSKFKQVAQQRDWKQLLEFDGLAVLAINAEALPSETTRAAIAAFLKARKKVGLVADESSFMAGAGNRRTRIMDNLSQRPEIVWKRILDGTPAGDGGLFDYFTQIRFLNRAILGFTTNAEFKERYAEWEIKINHTTGYSYPSQKLNDDGTPKFKNMDELWGKLNPISYRAKFADCFNTPKKIYQIRRFELTDEQRRVYNSLRDEFVAELSDGSQMTAAFAITRLMRLQQVASNYFAGRQAAEIHEPCEGLGCDHCDAGIVLTKIPAKQIDKVNPRLEALRGELQPGRQTLVWCRFRQDAADCYELAKEMGLNPARYDGSVAQTLKERHKDDFQAGKIGALICNQRSAGRGLPLWKAYGHVYYSNTFSLRDRLQSEDRSEIAHRKVGTSVVDLIAEDTVDDMAILPALRSKMDVVAYVMRENKREWL